MYLRATAILLLTLLSATVAAADPEQNMRDAAEVISQVRGLTVESSFGESLCRDASYCDAYAGNVQMQAMGGNLDLLTTSLDSVEEYQRTCVGALMGLAGLDRRSAEQYIVEMFDRAAQTGNAKAEIGRVEITVRPSFDDRLGCQFFRR